MDSQKVKDDLRKQKIELPESELDSVVTWENLLLPWIKLIPKSLVEVTFTSEKKVIFKQKLDRTDINIEGMDQRNITGQSPGRFLDPSQDYPKEIKITEFFTDFKFEITGEILKGSEVNEMEALAKRANSIKISNGEFENQQNRKLNKTENGTQNESELHEIDEGDILRQFHCDIDSVEELMAEGCVHNIH